MKISFDFEDHISGSTPNARGHVVFEPSHRHVHVDNSLGTVRPFTVTFTQPFVVDLEATTLGWAWKITVTTGGKSWSGYYVVTRDSDFTKLVSVDPESLEPDTEPEPAWWVMARSTVNKGEVIGGHLWLTRADGAQFDAGVVQGEPGLDGRDGADGHDGRDGRDGAPGVEGKDGVSAGLSVVDYPTIQDALNVGGKIIFPYGNYNVTSQLTVKSGSVIDLCGSTINGGGFIVENESKSVVISNGTIKNSPDAGVRVQNAVGVTIENMRIESCKTGISLTGVGTGSMYNYGVRVSNCEVINTRDGALQTYRSKGAVFENVYVLNARWGVNILSFTENVALVNSRLILGLPSETPTGDDSFYTGAPEHGLYAHNHNGLKVDGCHFEGWSRATGCSGVKIRNGYNSLVTNTMIRNCAQEVGLFIQDGSADNVLRNTRFNACTIENTVTGVSTVFIKDYISSGTEIDVAFDSCTFPGKSIINPSAGSGMVIFKGCSFDDKVVSISSGAFYKIFNSCTFERSSESNLQVGYRSTVKDCTFKTWNLNNVNTGALLEMTSGAISLQNHDTVAILRNKFLDNTKRIVGAYGTVAGRVNKLRILYNEGGKDVSVYQTGNVATNHIGFNTMYGASPITPNGNNLATLGNNIKISEDGTFSTF